MKPLSKPRFTLCHAEKVFLDDVFIVFPRGFEVVTIDSLSVQLQVLADQIQFLLPEDAESAVVVWLDVIEMLKHRV